MLEEKRLRNYRTSTARSEQPGKASDEVDEKNDRGPHPRILAGPEMLWNRWQNNNSPTTGSTGWLFALSDKQMSAVISSMHDDPAHDWTVEELGQRAGMSRSTFALRFKKTVGMSPLEYLTRWRMLLAADRMANTSDSISEIARSLGYESASAFTKAFKKTMGRSPRQYGRDRNSVSPADREGEAAGANRLQHRAIC